MRNPGLLVCFLWGSSVFAQHEKDISQYEASGAVKSIVCHSRSLSADNPSGTSLGTHPLDDRYYTDYAVGYNKRGQLLSRSLFDASGTVVLDETFTYKGGRLASHTSGIETSHYTYDADGLLTLVVSRAREDVVKLFCHNENGHETRRVFVDEHGDTTWLLFFAYDANGRMIRDTYRKVEPGEEYYCTTFYSYDPDGNLLRSEDSSAHSTSIVEMTYENGLPKTKTERDIYSFERMDICSETLYEKGLIIQVRWYEEDRSSGEQVDQGLQRIGYVFDAKGNWTQKTYSNESGAFLVAERVLTYY